MLRPMYETWEQLPNGSKQEIEATHALWNQLVETFERRQVRYREIVAQPSQGAEDAAKLRLTLAQLQRDFLAETHWLATTCPAIWSNREFVLSQFLATVSRFFKKQGRPPKPKHGAPRDVHFHHRFANGGFPVHGIFGRSQRLCLEPVSAEAFHPALSQRQRKRLARTSGVFQVGNISLPFQLLLHRALPEGGILKAAALIGRQMLRSGFHNDAEGGHRTSARWVWSLQLTLEILPRVLHREEGKVSTVLLDISRQVGGEGRLRAGVVVDSTGREEPLFLPEEIIRAWRYKRQLQQRADRLLDETKGLLKEVYSREELPVTLRALLTRVEILREKGLWRLLQILEATNINEAALEILRHWADQVTRITREARGLERRYLARRDWFYRNIALQLCRRYQQIVVKLPHPLEVQAQYGDEQTPHEATRYRQLAAPSTLFSCTLQTAVKTGTKVEKAPTPILV
jgi:hypothetical protein